MTKQLYTAATMNTLIDRLKRFNRKERLFLVGLALDNPNFTLGPKFRSSLGDLFDPKLTIRTDAFVAMDYHLEWLYVALRGAELGQRYQNTGFVKGNQGDVDLLVAFEDGTTTHVILVEAKGDTAWSNKQMKSKAERLRVAFDGINDTVKPHFAFISPSPPQHLISEGWPNWISTSNHLVMQVTGDLKVTRCDIDMRSRDKGPYWMMCSVRPNQPVDPS